MEAADALVQGGRNDAGGGFTGQADGGLLLILEHVQQRVCETRLFFGLQLSVSCGALHGLQRRRLHV